MELSQGREIALCKNEDYNVHGVAVMSACLWLLVKGVIFISFWPLKAGVTLSRSSVREPRRAVPSRRLIQPLLGNTFMKTGETGDVLQLPSCHNVFHVMIRIFSSRTP